MRIICPYCGKSQDAKNTSCQYCQATLPPEGVGAPDEAAGPTALCTICMLSFPAKDLQDYEGQRICEKCLQKVRRRDTTVAPTLKKAPEPEEVKAGPARRFAGVFLVGLLLIALAAVGAWQGYLALCRSRERAVKSARKEMTGIIEQCNQALVMLMQPDPEPELLEQARSTLYQCKLDLASEGLRGVTAAFGPLEEFRERTEGLQRLRWQCASTLMGEPVPGGPPTSIVARQWLSDSSKEAKAIVSDLARELRLYRLSVEGFVVY